jgi:hypothetical protein
LFEVEFENSVQKPLVTATKVEQSVTPSGQLIWFDTEIQRSTSVAFKSCSSITAFADKDIWKGAHGLQEYTTVWELSRGFFLNAANWGRAHCMREPMNNGNTPFCKDINELPALVKSAWDCDGS